MTSMKLKLKLNNSYESDPSSNSGSSANDSNYYDHNMDMETGSKLQEFFQPDLYYEPEEENFTDIIKEEENFNKFHDRSPVKKLPYINNPLPLLNDKVRMRGQAVNSSQESDFAGFTDSQVLQVNQFQTSYLAKHLLDINLNRTKVATAPIEKKDTSKYHGMIIGENSNNAVDMILPNANDAIKSPRKPSITEDLSEFLTFNGKFQKIDDETTIGKVETAPVADPVTADEDAEPSDMDVDDLIEYEPEGTPFREPEGYPDKHDDTSAVGVISSIFPTETDEAVVVETPAAAAAVPVVDVLTQNDTLRYQNERSPDLFSDEEEEDDDDEVEVPVGNDDNETEAEEEEDDTLRECESELNETKETDCINYSIKRDKEVFKRVQNSMSGVPPPPSLTILQLNMFETIMKHKESILNFNLNGVSPENNPEYKPSLFKPSHSLEDCCKMEWKDIYNVSQHGISYNVSKASEKIELLSLAVLERYVGSETATSYHISPSSGKKRNMRLKMLTQSPGSRLSHLAKRRSIFSSANMQSNLQKLVPSGGRQILLDTKKNKPKRKGMTPKRQTPSSRKKISGKTPSTSARKRLFYRTDPSKPGPSRETSKRALFQSPAKPAQKVAQPVKPLLKPEIANRVERSKRALFSPDKSSQESTSSLFSSQSSQSSNALRSDNLLKRKRTSDQCDNDDTCSEKGAKLFRTSKGDNITPRSMKFKSQSFCIGAGTRASSMLTSTLGTTSGKSLIRASSDTSFAAGHLTENHRKKLLWAVSQALQLKQISVTNVNFKTYASVLARVIKRLFLEFHQKSSTSVSETMLRLAKKYVYLVMAGRSADDIYIFAKSKLESEKSSTSRLSGYIAPKEYEERKTQLQRSTSCQLGPENSMDAFTFSQSFKNSQSSVYPFSQDSTTSSRPNSAIKLPIQPSKALQKSSSKSNLGPSALRENSDCELRRSAQKNFTGKDQRNVSPYMDRSLRSSAVKASSSTYSAFSEVSNSVKVRRQIKFDG